MHFLVFAPHYQATSVNFLSFPLLTWMHSFPIISFLIYAALRLIKKAANISYSLMTWQLIIRTKWKLAYQRIYIKNCQVWVGKSTCLSWYQVFHWVLSGRPRDSTQYLDPITGTLPSVSPLLNTKTKKFDCEKKKKKRERLFFWIFCVTWPLHNKQTPMTAIWCVCLHPVTSPCCFPSNLPLSFVGGFEFESELLR